MTIEEQLEELDAIKAVYEDSLTYSQKEIVKGELIIQLESLSKSVTLFYEVAGEGKERVTDVLPPVSMIFEFPADYPQVAPVVSVQGIWISHELADIISREIRKTCEEYVGFTVLFFCRQAIVDAIEQYLENHPRLDVSDTPYGNVKGLKGPDIFKRMNSLCEGEKSSQFESTCFDCEVCFENKMGRYCVKFFPCSHVYCKECIKGYYISQLQSQQVKVLECLSDKCTSMATDSVIKEAVGEEDFLRYENLILQNAIEKMDDVMPCPRKVCQNPVIVNTERRLGECHVCGFSFCTICRKAYHGINKCVIKAVDRMKLLKNWEKADEVKRKKMGEMFGGYSKLKELVDGLQYQTWAEENSKACPKCHVDIEKQHGCNKMACSHCQTVFCWLCSKVLKADDPYAHFNAETGGCFNRLFEGVDQDDDSDDEPDWLDDLWTDDSEDDFDDEEVNFLR